MQPVFKAVFRLVLPLILLGVVVLGLFNLTNIFDWWRLLDYKPSSTLTDMAAKTTMTSYAKHIFYVNHPKIESDGAQFRKDCTVTEQTIVLGCYHSHETGIYIYQVDDKRLNGIEEVTAAHETLHGIYDRLSSSERNRVNALLNNYYNNDLHDQRIIDTINSYKKTEPNDLLNEMHSVFGTEVANLPAPLEQYYQKYFTNRAAVVAISDSYESEFTTRESRIKAIEQQLDSLKQTINTEEDDLNVQLTSIDTQRTQLDNLKNSNNSDAYNAAVPTFNALVDSYNNNLAKLKADIANFNSLVKEHNDIASELKGLYQSIEAIPQQAASQ